MKHLSILLFLLITYSCITAQQSGVISYTETVELNITSSEGMDIEGLFGNSMTAHKDLFFSNTTSIYKDSKNNVNEDQEISSDDGSFKMILKTSSAENVHYTDIENESGIYQTDFMGKVFLIENDLSKQKWKLTDEKIKYLGYVCYKAELTIEANKEGEEDKHIVAWFTPEIPVSIGPETFGQLPGAILMINEDDGRKEIKATEVQIEEVSEELLTAPSKGERVSKDEFDTIVEEKMKEMEGMHGSGTRIFRH